MGFLQGCWAIIVAIFFIGLLTFAFGPAGPWIGGGVLALIPIAILIKFALDKSGAAEKLNAKQARVAGVSIGNQLSAELTSAVPEAPRFAADENWSYRIVDSKNYAANFEALRAELEATDGEAIEFQLGLVCAASPEDRKVLVTGGPYVLGYVAKVQSVALYDTVWGAGGVARCNGKVTFDVASSNSQVQIDISQPFALIVGA